MASVVSTGTIPAGSTERWKDRKRYLWLIGLVVPSLAFVAFAGYVATGWGVWFWVGPIVILGIVPAIDLVAGAAVYAIASAFLVRLDITSPVSGWALNRRRRVEPATDRAFAGAARRV